MQAWKWLLIGAIAAATVTHGAFAQNAWLGFQVKDTSTGKAGAEVVVVAPKGPAERAGLRPTDVILKIDGADVQDAKGVVRRIVQRGAGASVAVLVLRGGEEVPFTIKLEEPPLDTSAFAQWLETYVAAQGGCRNFLIILDRQIDTPLTTVQRGSLDDRFLSRPLSQWADGDFAAARQLFKSCVGRVLQASTAPPNAKRSIEDLYDQTDKRLQELIAAVQNLAARKKAHEAAQIALAEAESRRQQEQADADARRRQAQRDEQVKRDREAAQRRREQTDAEARLKQEQLREQAQGDRETTEEVARLAEIEEKTIGEAVKEAAEARRARQAAEQRLAETRSRLDAEQQKLRDELAQARAAEAAREQELQREASRAEETRLSRKCKVSIEQFSAVRFGMTLREVERIFGCKGTEVSGASFSGGVAITYSWEGNVDRSAVSAMFNDYVLSSKVQVGLH